ncbi:hypothetical protein SAMN04488524_3187 [Pedobacter africanus]|uniref:Uncharacterized protein n=1 Tax=Pedobacter africanus TaxID=151894 RepID=A0A1W2CS78_9SPHI|nr:hypothetical protein SAMN04488524_3187 [Pedobacter africanus]
MFDYRLIKENVDSVANEADAFDVLTNKVGKIKFFIGIEEILINAINNRDNKYLAEYNSETTFCSRIKFIYVSW